MLTMRLIAIRSQAGELPRVTRLPVPGTPNAKHDWHIAH